MHAAAATAATAANAATAATAATAGKHKTWVAYRQHSKLSPQHRRRCFWCINWQAQTPHTAAAAAAVAAAAWRVVRRVRGALYAECAAQQHSHSTPKALRWPAARRSWHQRKPRPAASATAATSELLKHKPMLGQAQARRGILVPAARLPSNGAAHEGCIDARQRHAHTQAAKLATVVARVSVTAMGHGVGGGLGAEGG